MGVVKGNVMEEKKEHEHCLRCGRKLKNPQARQLGYGAICYRKIQSNGAPIHPLFALRKVERVSDI